MGSMGWMACGPKERRAPEEGEGDVPLEAEINICQLASQFEVEGGGGGEWEKRNATHT
jgi:hypothetical protein